MENKDVLKVFSIALRMGKIEAGPPLSTILGNVGVNTVKFCKELNEFTKDLPFYFLLEVKIFIYLDKTYSFKVIEPSVALLLRLLTFKKELLVNMAGGSKKKTLDVIRIEDLYLISFFKFGNCSSTSLKSVYGTTSSLNLNVIK
jgi:large subunit ribosomal protein L11